MKPEEAIKMLKSKMDGHTDTSYEWAETVRMAIEALKEKLQWIPVKYRKMTDDEVKEYEELIGEQIPENERVCFDCSMPEDDEEVLISTKWGVHLDRCEIDPDYGYGLEENGDWDGVLAWMKLPAPYKWEESK